MQPEDRQVALDLLTSVRDEFAVTVSHLNDAQTAYRQNSGRWSIYECVEHVAAVENTLFRIITTESFPWTPLPNDRELDERFTRGMVNRRRPFEAPPNAQPRGRFGDFRAALDTFLTAREKSIDYVKACPDDLRMRGTKHPVIGDIAAWHCLLVMALHPRRHLEQIREVMTSPGFPD